MARRQKSQSRMLKAAAVVRSMITWIAQRGLAKQDMGDLTKTNQKDHWGRTQMNLLGGKTKEFRKFVGLDHLKWWLLW